MNHPRILALVALGCLSVSEGSLADNVFAEIAATAIELGWVDEHDYMWCSEIISTRPPAEYYRISVGDCDWADTAGAEYDACVAVTELVRGILIWAAFNLCRGETLEWVNEYYSDFRFYVDDHNTITGTFLRVDEEGE